jgi:hypothetical protein
MTNEGQLPMMKNMLNSAKKVGIPLDKFHCYILKDNKKLADYQTVAFKHITTRKLEVIQLNLSMGPMFWVDNDIVFFENCIADVTSRPGAFVMQDDEWGYCTGFFFARPSLFSKQVISQSISWLKKHTTLVPNDQHAFNAVVVTAPVQVTKLPLLEYPNGKVYFELENKDKAKMVHCNFLRSTEEKVERLKEHGMWDESDDAFKFVHKYYI